MDSRGDDSEDLARWLQDVARRGTQTVAHSQVERTQHPPESSEEVLKYLEGLTGRKLRSREAVNKFLKVLAKDEAKRTREANKRRIAREFLLLGLLLAAYLHYYYWEVSLQIATLPKIQVFVPVDEHRDINRSSRLAV